MNLRNFTAYTIVACGMFSIFGMIASVLFLKGTQEYLTVRILGIVLILSVFGSQRLGRRTITDSRENDALKVRFRNWFISIQDLVAAVGIISSIFMAYLIFFCSDVF